MEIGDIRSCTESTYNLQNKIVPQYYKKTDLYPRSRLVTLNQLRTLEKDRTSQTCLSSRLGLDPPLYRLIRMGLIIVN